MKLLNKKVTVFLIVLFLVPLIFPFSVFADSGNEEIKQPQKVYELITGNHKEYYSKINIYTHSIVIEGCYKTDPPVSVDLKNNGSRSSTLKSYDEGRFSAVINPGEVYEKTDYIVITLKSGVRLTYRIEYSGGWYFPDNNILKQNISVLGKIIDTSPKAWVGYVTDEYTEESVKETLDKVMYLSDYIVRDIKSASAYEKTREIAKWVSENIYYDRDARDSSVTEETVCLKNVLETKKTVCSGYSNLFCALLEAQGIYAVNIRGTSTSDEVEYENLADARVNHEWTAVYIDNRWVTVDVVWNSGNKYQDGKYKRYASYEKYFDISDLALSFDHCAYLAEKRNFFRALEYFEQQSATTESTDTPAEVTTPADTTKPSVTTTTLAAEISSVPESTATDENISKDVGSDISESISADSADRGLDIKLLIILILGVIIIIMIAVIILLRHK